MPKKCGHILGREVIPAEEMVQKIVVLTPTTENILRKFS
jgi:2-methylisocitrate lyase-like PEP mutase family enzyme